MQIFGQCINVLNYKKRYNTLQILRIVITTKAGQISSINNIATSLVIKFRGGGGNPDFGDRMSF